MSFNGGMDLSKLKASGTIEEAQVLKVPSLVTEASEASLPSLVKVSATVPVIIEFFNEATDSTLEQVVRSLNGQVLLARHQTNDESKVAKAFGVKVVPSVYALVKGQPVPMFEGVLTAEQYLSVLQQLIQAAKAQQVSGRVVEGDVADAIPELPKPLQEALALVDGGQVDEALALLLKLKQEKPGDVATSALLAQVNLMKRTMHLEHERILETQPTNFDEAMELADVLAAIGDFKAAFELLLALYIQITPEEQQRAKARILEYFEIAGATNPEVKAARAKLATLLY